MLLNARKLLFILTPLLTLLITIGTIYLIHHLNIQHIQHQNQNQNPDKQQHKNQHLYQHQYQQQLHHQQQQIVRSRPNNTNDSNVSRRPSQPPVRREYLQDSNNSLKLSPSISPANHNHNNSNSEKLVSSEQQTSSQVEQQQEHQHQQQQQLVNGRQRLSRHEPKAMKPNENSQTGLIEKSNNNHSNYYEASFAGIVNKNNSGNTIVNISELQVYNDEYQAHTKEGSSQRTTTTKINKTKQQQQQQVADSKGEQSYDDTLKRTSFEIVLDRDNFVLTSRCSMNRVYIKVNSRTRRPIISTRPQHLFKQNIRGQKSDFSSSSSKNSNNNQKDIAQIKLLSTVITIESVTTSPIITTTTTTTTTSTLNANQKPSYNLGANLNNHQNATKRSNLPNVADSAIKIRTEEDEELEERQEEENRRDSSLLKGGDQVKSKKGLSTVSEERQHRVSAQEDEHSQDDVNSFPLDRLPAVRLRANLTQLYICFSLQGKLEGRVSSIILYSKIRKK